MPTARIYQAPKSSMSSGRRANVDKWIIEFEPAEAKQADPLTGWAGSGDTRDQLRLYFATREAAVAHAEREGWAFHVIEAPQRSLKLQAYADNFR